MLADAVMAQRIVFSILGRVLGRTGWIIARFWGLVSIQDRHPLPNVQSGDNTARVSVDPSRQAKNDMLSKPPSFEHPNLENIERNRVWNRHRRVLGSTRV